MRLRASVIHTAVLEENQRAADLHVSYRVRRRLRQVTSGRGRPGRPLSPPAPRLRSSPAQGEGLGGGGAGDAPRGCGAWRAHPGPLRWLRGVAGWVGRPGAREVRRVRRKTRPENSLSADPGYCCGRRGFARGEQFCRANWREALFLRSGQKRDNVCGADVGSIWACLSGIHFGPSTFITDLSEAQSKLHLLNYTPSTF